MYLKNWNRNNKTGIAIIKKNLKRERVVREKVQSRKVIIKIYI